MPEGPVTLADLGRSPNSGADTAIARAEVTPHRYLDRGSRRVGRIVVGLFDRAKALVAKVPEWPQWTTLAGAAATQHKVSPGSRITRRQSGGAARS